VPTASGYVIGKGKYSVRLLELLFLFESLEGIIAALFIGSHCGQSYDAVNRLSMHSMQPISLSSKGVITNPFPVREP